MGDDNCTYLIVLLWGINDITYKVLTIQLDSLKDSLTTSSPSSLALSWRLAMHVTAGLLRASDMLKKYYLTLFNALFSNLIYLYNPFSLKTLNIWNIIGKKTDCHELDNFSLSHFITLALYFISKFRQCQWVTKSIISPW